MKKRAFLSAFTLAALTLSSATVLAQDNKFKIGLILPMTGQQASTGRQIENGRQALYGPTRRHGGWQED